MTTPLRIALAQINPTVGALENNRNLIIEAAHTAAQQSANIIVFPELTISGYPPEDLILKKHFINDCEAIGQKLAHDLPPNTTCIVGSPANGNQRARNAAFVFHQGKQIARYDKILLPNYGVFDEKRVFEPGDTPLALQIGQARIAINICEDSWFDDSPAILPLQHQNLDLLVNLSASPFHAKKTEKRWGILSRTAKQLNCWFAYANLLGGQDELVFDGDSMFINPQGHRHSDAKQFQNDILYLDLPLTNKKNTPSKNITWINIPPPQPTNPPPLKKQKHSQLDTHTEIYQALVMGTRDYIQKTGFKKALIAISGGIDSALVAAIAVDALGPDRILGVTMPSQYSSDGTLNDAKRLAKSLRFNLHTLPIKNLFQNYTDQLHPYWKDLPQDVAEENLQARIRGTLIMAFSNKHNWIVLTTGNKSELATGYCTLYGDMAGGFAVIKDVPKQLVFDLCRWRNQQGDGEIIPNSIITRPPSAELRADQKDSDSLPPYDILDAILERYIELDWSAASIIADDFDPDTVHRIIRLVDINEYKRRQAPPGIKITPKAFGRDRRMPIVNHYREPGKPA